MSLREVHIRVPRDILRKLLDSQDRGVPFQTDELGFPLRIVLWGAPARRGRKFKPAPKEEGEGDAV